MECSLLGDKRFFPWVHEYTVAPSIHTDQHVVAVHPDDAWLLHNAPTLVLQPYNATQYPLKIEPLSAARMLFNTAFNAKGELSRISPALLRAHGACWILASTLQGPKLFSAQPIFQTRPDLGGMPSVRSRYQKRSRKRTKNAQPALWQCQSVSHTNTMEDVTCPRLRFYWDINMCVPCIHKNYVAPPPSWYHITLLDRYCTNIFLETVIQPLSTHALRWVLLGAVFADSAMCRLDPTRSLTDQYTTIARCIYERPEVFVSCQYELSYSRSRRAWGHVLSMESCAIVTAMLDRALRRPRTKHSDLFTERLCVYGYAAVLPEHYNVTHKQKRICVCIAPTMADFQRQTAKTLVTELPLTPFCAYRDLEDKHTWVFMTSFVQTLYTLALKPKKIQLQLTASFAGQSFEPPAHAVHPHALYRIPANASHVTVYASELLNWKQLCRLVCMPTVQTLTFLGNYSTARFGIQTPIRCFTDGACFADFVDILHLDLTHGESEVPRYLVPSCVHLPLDRTHMHPMPNAALVALEQYEARTWHMQQWKVPDLTRYIQDILDTSHPVQKILKAHTAPATAHLVPHTLRVTLLALTKLGAPS